MKPKNSKVADPFQAQHIAEDDDSLDIIEGMPTGKADKIEFNHVLNKIIKADSKTLKQKAYCDIVPSKGSNDKILELNKNVMEYRYMLEGKTYDEEKSRYIQTTSQAAGDTYIRFAVENVRTFSNETNLLSSKNWDHFLMQFYESFKKILVFARKDKTISDEKYRWLLKLHKDKLWNAGNIITDNKDTRTAILMRDLHNDNSMLDKFNSNTL